jgi:hypothetical protein
MRAGLRVERSEIREVRSFNIMVVVVSEANGVYTDECQGCDVVDGVE